MRGVLASFSLIALASIAVAAHAQQRTTPQQKPAGLTPPVMRVRVPAAFAHVANETTTVNGKTANKGDLLAHIDPAQVFTLPTGKKMTAQAIFDGVGRSEDKALKANATLKAIPIRRMAMINPAVRIAAQKQKLAAAKQRLLAAKAGGWRGGLVEHPSAGGGSTSDLPMTGKTSIPRARHRSMVKRMVSPCAFYPGHAPTCVPDFSAIDAPPWSQDVGDTSVVGASTTLSVSGSSSADGEQSSCSLTWDNSVSVFNQSNDMFQVVASETTNARAHSFSGSLAVYIAGNAIGVPDDGAEGSSGSLISESLGFKAGGKIPLIGPIYLNLTLEASATVQLALVGERRLVIGDPTAALPVAGGGAGGASAGGNPTAHPGVVPGIPAVGIPHETHGTHCHVGVEPSLDTDVQLTAGLGVGIDDIVDLMHIDVTGDIHPITASVPTHVTLDLQRAPPGGQIAFDSHLKATFMKSQLSFDWQIFDVCYSSPVGTVCLLRDILQIPTSGSVVIAQDEGFDPLDIDLMGGGRAIKWKPK